MERRLGHLPLGGQEHRRIIAGGDDATRPPEKATLARARTRVTPSSRKEVILASAANYFYTKGFHATTIQDIATDVGMLKGSLYYYIRSKEDMLYELLTDVLVRGEATLEENIASTADPLEKLRRALEGHIEHIIKNQSRVGLFLHEFDTLTGIRRERVRKAMQRYQDRLVEIIREGQAAGKFVPGPPWVLAHGILGMCNWIPRWFHGNHLPPLKTVQRVYVQLVITGVLKR